MRLESKIGLAAAILLACACITSAQSLKETMAATICKLFTNPSAYDGKLVRIRAVYAGSFEGSYLIDSKCRKGIWFTTPEGNASVAAIVIQGSHPKAPEASFALVKDNEYEKFARFAYATVKNLDPEYEVTASFIGRIDHCKHFKLASNGFGNGFGQMGQSEFQFVLRSVSDVSVKDATGSLSPTLIPSVLPDRLAESQ